MGGGEPGQEGGGGLEHGLPGPEGGRHHQGHCHLEDTGMIGGAITKTAGNFTKR